jgi:hypothetical protein
MPTTITIDTQGDPGGNVISYHDTNFTTACNGSNLIAATGDYAQTRYDSGIPRYYVTQAFVNWDISALPNDATILSASMNFRTGSIYRDRSWVLEWYRYRWGPTPDVSDFRNVAQLDAMYDGGAGRIAILNDEDMTTLSRNTMVDAGGGVAAALQLDVVEGNSTFKVMAITNKNRAVNAPALGESDSYGWYDFIGAYYNPQLIVTYSSVSEELGFNLGVAM